MKRLYVAGPPKPFLKLMKRLYWTFTPKRLHIVKLGKEPFILAYLPWKRKGNSFYYLRVSNRDDENWLRIESTSGTMPYVYSWKKAYEQLLEAKKEREQAMYQRQLNRSLEKKIQGGRGYAEEET